MALPSMRQSKFALEMSTMSARRPSWSEPPAGVERRAEGAGASRSDPPIRPFALVDIGPFPPKMSNPAAAEPGLTSPVKFPRLYSDPFEAETNVTWARRSSSCRSKKGCNVSQAATTDAHGAVVCSINGSNERPGRSTDRPVGGVHRTSISIFDTRRTVAIFR